MDALCPEAQNGRAVGTYLGTYLVRTLHCHSGDEAPWRLASGTGNLLVRGSEPQPRACHVGNLGDWVWLDPCAKGPGPPWSVSGRLLHCGRLERRCWGHV